MTTNDDYVEVNIYTESNPKIRSRLSLVQEMYDWINDNTEDTPHDFVRPMVRMRADVATMFKMKFG